MGVPASILVGTYYAFTIDFTSDPNIAPQRAKGVLDNHITNTIEYSYNAHQQVSVYGVWSLTL